MNTKQWFWMMEYCKKQCIPPAQSWAWEMAKQAYDKMIETTENYWDCECRHNYIHPAAVTECVICKAVREEQPDSMISEVRVMIEGVDVSSERIKAYCDLSKTNIPDGI